MSKFLDIQGLTVRFGGLTALNAVDLAADEGEFIGIIGPNGAGKTTFFNLLTGQLAPTEGEVRLRGKRINELAPHARARLGMGRTFQIAKPLIALNALENVMIGAFMRHPKLSVARDKAMSVLEEVSMGHLARRRAGDLTLSERRRLEVARALALEPEIVLLDEVMAGLTPVEVAQMLQTLRQLQAARGLTLLVIEHVMRALMDLCGRIVVLHHGELIADGTPRRIADDARVLSVYFGQHEA